LEGNLQTVPDAAYNKEVKADPDWEPGWLRYSFSGFLVCDNLKCKGKVVVAGRMESGTDHYQVGPNEWEEENFKKCFPKYFDRPPEIIPLDDHIPAELREVLIESFRLFWLDAPSCANKIRTCVELLLNQFDVARYARRKKKRVPISLDSRIKDFALKNPDVSEKLLAVKWIGNAGSHPGTLSKEDLLDGYRILNYSLKKLFANDDAEIHRLTKQINKRKRPISLTRRKPQF